MSRQSALLIAMAATGVGFAAAQNATRTSVDVPPDPCVELIRQILTDDGPAAGVVLALATEVRILRESVAECTDRVAVLADERARLRLGDFNLDGIYNSRDVDLLTLAIAAANAPLVEPPTRTEDGEDPPGGGDE